MSVAFKLSIITVAFNLLVGAQLPAQAMPWNDDAESAWLSEDLASSDVFVRLDAQHRLDEMRQEQQAEMQRMRDQLDEMRQEQEMDLFMFGRRGW
jgi:hypothetical protein